jgi:hypothetical protein
MEKIQKTKVEFEYAAAPGFVDWLLYTINKNNANDTIFIYKKEIAN